MTIILSTKLTDSIGKAKKNVKTNNSIPLIKKNVIVKI